jgi:hypothetical protein
VTNAELETEPLDLLTVTAAAFEVTRQDGTRQTWAVDIAEQTEILLVLDHEFAITDVDQAGRYSIAIVLTVPAGIRRAGPTVLQVT